KTVVMLTDDGALSTAPIASAFPSEVYCYVGTKTNRGSTIDRAGLTNGNLSLTLNCRLWRLRFDDVERPELGGTIQMLLKGTEGHGLLDNVTIDRLGRIVMDEDPGNNARVSKVWAYQISTGEFLEVAHHNPAFFDPTQ